MIKGVLLKDVCIAGIGFTYSSLLFCAQPIQGLIYLFSIWDKPLIINSFLKCILTSQ